MARRAKIHAIERKDGKKRWGISVPRPGLPPRREYFDSPQERDAAMRAMIKRAEREGPDVLSVTSADAHLLNDLRDILPANVDPREAARLWVKMNGGESCSLEDASKEYRITLQNRRLSADYQSQVNRALRRFEGAVNGKTSVGDITGRQVEAWIYGLGFKSLRSLDNYHTYMKSFFDWCVRRGYCRKSPMESLDGVNVPESEPNVMPVDDVRLFFKKCLESNPKAAPFLALAFFAGIRSSHIPRLKRADINFEERGITMPGATHKTRKRFYVEGHEDNLWAWLEPLRDMEDWRPFADSTFRDWREKIYLKSGVDYPQNGARDSFCSYHIALHNDASRTATLLTHRGVGMLYGHYLGAATRRDAEAFFSIVP